MLARNQIISHKSDKYKRNNQTLDEYCLSVAWNSSFLEKLGNILINTDYQLIRQ